MNLKVIVILILVAVFVDPLKAENNLNCNQATNKSVFPYNITESYNNFVKASLVDCKNILNSPDCVELSTNIKKNGENVQDYMKACTSDELSISHSFYLATVGNAWNCAIGAFDGSFGDMGKQIGELAAESVISFEQDKVCNSNLEYKRLLYKAHNANLDKELQIDIPSDAKLKAYSCSTLKQAIYEEDRYLKVKRNRGQNQVQSSDNAGLLKLAESKLKEMGVKLQCYKPEKVTELTCKAVALVAMAVIPETAIMKVKSAAGFYSAQRFATASKVKALEETQSIYRVASICDDCPALSFNKESILHIEGHISKVDLDRDMMKNISSLSLDEKKTLVRDALSSSRDNVDTTVFSKDFDLEKLVKNISSKNTWTERAAQKEGRRLFRGDVFVDGKKYEIEMVFCAEPICVNRDGLSFKKGDVISLYPKCGPGVVYIPRTSTLEGFLEGKTTAWRDVRMRYMQCK